MGVLLPINSRINKSKGGSSNEYFESISRLNMLLSGCILMVCWSIMYVEIYRLTKSVWPCVIMHAIEDAVPAVLVTLTGIITLTNSSDFWLNLLAGRRYCFISRNWNRTKNYKNKKRTTIIHIKKQIMNSSLSAFQF